MGDRDLPEGVVAQLDALQSTLDKLESGLKPLITLASQDSADAQMTPLERAQVELALARSANALLQLYLRASGTDPTDHDARKELDRLAQYERKVKKAVAQKDLSESKRSLEVDVAAVNRFITAAVPDLSTNQKQGLKIGGSNSSGKQKGVLDDGENVAKRRKSGNKDAALAFLTETMAEVQAEAGDRGRKKS